MCAGPSEAPAREAHSGADTSLGLPQFRLQVFAHILAQ